MTDQHPENNRVLHELFRKCWHEYDLQNSFYCLKCEKRYQKFEQNPDYAVDPRLVLEGMREKNRLGDFLIFLCQKQITIPESSYRIDVDLILDRTGRLRDLAIGFLKEGK